MARKTQSENGPLIAGVMLAMIAVPVALTLHTVKVAATLHVASDDPTPYGYTISLLLFIVPIVVIGWWLVPSEELKLPRRAFWHTIAILAPCGFALDFFCATRFFTFANTRATLQIPAPAIGGSVPIEEYVFYLTGFIVVLLIYVWLDEYWLAAYAVPEYRTEAENIHRLLTFHPWSLGIAVLLIAGAIVYKKFVSDVPSGWPEYFMVLIGVGLTPALGFYPHAKKLINWRAFSLTIFMILLISMFWEATLAIPYGWWGYQKERMMGLPIGAWSDLPIEAVFVWIAVTYATVFVFEVVRVWQASGRPARDAFLGRKTPPSTQKRSAGQ